jgi:hypothetical protein
LWSAPTKPSGIDYAKLIEIAHQAETQPGTRRTATEHRRGPRLGPRRQPARARPRPTPPRDLAGLARRPPPELNSSQPDPPAQSQLSTTLAIRSGKHTDHTKQGVHQTRDASKNLQAADTLDFYLVLHWVDGRWEGEHTGPTECSPVGNSSVSSNETELDVFSLDPQPDGTYSGTLTYTIQTNECYQQGSVRELPLTAVRTGPAPPGIVADPPTMSALPQPTAHR